MIVALAMLALATPSLDALVATSTLTPREIDAIISGRGPLPALARVQAAALEEWGAREPEWLARARWRGLVPRVEVSIGTDLDVDVRDSVDSRTILEGHALGGRISARFDLGQLVFADEEPRAAKDAEDRRAARRALLERVTELYFDRLAVLLAEIAAPTPTLTLRAKALDGQLRALTGGRIDRAELP